ncbi:hypothetical protein B0H14DRAFT_2577596 [Mycena olivaceomarginata]|nr:hypothetical protein B0H14DRAFT_2577596 [Mycena olivaceomarginata]
MHHQEDSSITLPNLGNAAKQQTQSPGRMSMQSGDPEKLTKVHAVTCEVVRCMYEVLARGELESAADKIRTATQVVVLVLQAMLELHTVVHGQGAWKANTQRKLEEVAAVNELGSEMSLELWLKTANIGLGYEDGQFSKVAPQSGYKKVANNISAIWNLRRAGSINMAIIPDGAGPLNQFFKMNVSKWANVISPKLHIQLVPQEGWPAPQKDPQASNHKDRAVKVRLVPSLQCWGGKHYIPPFATYLAQKVGR